MFCTVCGAQVPEGSSYCEVCGAQIDQVQVPQPQPVPQQVQVPQQQPVPQQVQVPQPQPVPQQIGSMNQVMQQHEYARQMQQQFYNQAKDAEREVTQTQGMAISNPNPLSPSPYPSIHQGDVSQSLLPEDNQVSQQYPPMMQQPAPRHPVMQQMPQKKFKKAGDASGKKSKAPIIIAIIALLLIVAAVIVFVVVKPFKKKNAQTKALDQYFDAINDLDIRAIDEASYPKDILKYDAVGYEDHISYNNLYSHGMGFQRGLASSDIFRAEKSIMDSYPKFDIRHYSSSEEYQDMMTNNDRFKELYKGFSASYELDELYKWDEVTLSRRKGLTNIEITDIDELIAYRDSDGESKYLDIDDVYVAKIKVKWYYDDMLYGYDKAWWSNPDLEELLEKTSNETYKKTISRYDDYTYTMVIYQYQGEWYVYPEGLTAALTLYVVEPK